MPRSDVITVAELLGRNPGSAPHVPLPPRNIPQQARRQPWLTRSNKTSAVITFGSVLAVGTTLAVGSTLFPHLHTTDETVPPGTTPVTDTTSVTPHETVPEHTPPAPSGLTAPSGPSGPSALTGPPAPAAPFAHVGPSGQASPARPDQGRPDQSRLNRSDPSARSGAPGSAHQGTVHVPAQRSAPAQHSVPAQRSAPVQHSAPSQRSAPAQRSAPQEPSSTQGRHAADVPRGPHLDEQGVPMPGTGAPGRSGRHRDDSDRQRPYPRHDGYGPSRNDRSERSGGLLDLGDTLRGLGSGLL